MFPTLHVARFEEAIDCKERILSMHSNNQGVVLYRRETMIRGRVTCEGVRWPDSSKGSSKSFQHSSFLM